MHIIKHFLRILSVQTFVVIALSFVATYICLKQNWVVELPTTLIGIAIVFPIVFSINAAYRRREEGLRYFSSLKAHCIALFYAHRDWVPHEGSSHAERCKELIVQLLQSIRSYFSDDHENPDSFNKVYEHFSQFSLSIEKLRAAGLPATEASRANQYMRTIMIDFERMRNILIYRTPTSLRAYSQVFLNAFPVLFAPYFAALSAQHFYSLGFAIAAFYSLVLVSLDNIQELLENPYDEVGVDDIDLNVSSTYANLMNEK